MLPNLYYHNGDINMMTRRGFLGFAGAVIATALGMACTQEEKPIATPTPEVKEKVVVKEVVKPLPMPPWPYKKIDPDYAAELGYQGYMGKTFDGEKLPGKACCFGAFYAIVKPLAEEVGSPYTEFLPVASIATVGEGGLVGWASLCGALNGAAWAIWLVAPEEEAKKVIDELYAWYMYEELPKYTPPKAMKAELSPFPTSVANSVLCHASVTNWCEVSGYKAFSKERSERCGRLTADVAKKAVELLNAVHEGTFVPAYPLDDKTKSCKSCHTKGSALENTRGKMACWSCHTEEGAMRVEEVKGHPEI